MTLSCAKRRPAVNALHAARRQGGHCLGLGRMVEARRRPEGSRVFGAVKQPGILRNSKLIVAHKPAA
jgi:hypothetical protein